MYKASQNILLDIKLDQNPLILEEPFPFFSLTREYIYGYGFRSKTKPEINEYTDIFLERQFDKLIKNIELHLQEKISNLSQKQVDFFVNWIYNEGYISGDRLITFVLSNSYQKAIDYIKNSHRYLNKYSYDTSTILQKNQYTAASREYFNALFVSGFSKEVATEKAVKTQKAKTGTSNQAVSNNTPAIQQISNNDSIALKIDDPSINTLGVYLSTYRDILIVDTNPELETLASILTPLDIACRSIFNYKNNWISIIYNYTDEMCLSTFGQSKDDIMSTDKAPSLKVKPQNIPLIPTTFIYIEKEKTKDSIRISQGVYQETIATVDVNEYIKTEIKALIESDGYKPVEEIKQSFSKYVKENPGISVYLWSKAYNREDTTTIGSQFPVKGTIINLTPFLDSCSMSQSLQGNGTFNITLPPIMCKWSPNTESYTMNDESLIIKENTVIADFYSKNTSHIFDTNNELVQNNLFFNSIISQNDLIFIAYEELVLEKGEKKNRSNIATKFILSETDIAGKVYDLIGLVDSVSKNYTEEANDITITVTGRDLSKLLTDDQTRFYYLLYENQNTQGAFAPNNSIQQRSFGRLKAESSAFGQAKQGRNVVNKEIFDTIDAGSVGYFIDSLLITLLQKLSNIEICPSHVFSAFRDKSMFEDKEGFAVDPLGIWQIFKVYIDKAVSKLKPIDASLSIYEGNLMGYVNKICQAPFVEVFGDTYNDKYSLIIRKPPFDYRGYTDLPKVVIEAKDVLSDSLSYENTAYSHFNITPKAGFIPGVLTDINFITAIYLHEYAQYFGVKPFEVTHNYLPELNYIKDSDSRQAYITLLKDLQYVIECSAYLPFSRRGTISLRGMRTVKKGTLIHYKPSNEYYYVEGVSHSYSIRGGLVDRTTTLQVSRGLITDYVVKPLLDNTSYFNIVQFQFDENYIRQAAGSKNFSANFYIKKADVVLKNFNFFLQRKQLQGKSQDSLIAGLISPQTNLTA